MALTKIALTLLGTIGLTAGTVLAVAEPTPEPLPAAVAKTSSCGKCSKSAPACGKNACKTVPVAVTAAACQKDACSKQTCTQKTAAKAACDKAACTEAVSVKNACSKTEACSKKQCESQVSLDKSCEGASACGKTQAKACAGNAKVAACGKTPCQTQPVSTTACAKKSDGEKSACAKGKCTEAVSTKTPCEASNCDQAVSNTADCKKSKCTEAVSTKVDCEKSKCSEAVSAKAACDKSKCTEAVAATAKCESKKCSTEKCTESVSTKADCGKSKCTEAVSAQAECEASKCAKAVAVKADCGKSKCSEAVSAKAACDKSKCTEPVAATAKCESKKCGTGKCTEAVSTKADCDKSKCTEAVSAKACAKDACSAKACAKDACSTKACAAECGQECCGKCEGKCDKCPCKAKAKVNAKCDKGEKVVDIDACRAAPVAVSAKIEAGTCESDANGQCQGHTVYGIDFRGMKPSIQRRTVYVANCSRCRAAHEEHGDHDIVATSCEAKPACITSACPVSSCLGEASDVCDCSVCVYDDCRGECACADRDLARNSEPASAACRNCDECRCGACACDAAAPHAGHHAGINHSGDRPGVAHVGHFRFEHFAPGAAAVFGWSSQCMDPAYGPADAGWEPQQDAYGQDMVHFNPEQEAPGRIRLRTVMPQMFAGHPPHLPPAMAFQMPHPGMAMSSFGMPVSAAMPAQRPERRAVANSVEGTWSRTIGDETVVFTCENGRLWGRMEGGSLEFSGTCSVSEDGQIFGLIDNIEAPGVPGKFTSWLVDQPFAVRFRLDGGDLIVKDFRCADLPTTIEHGDEEIPVGDAVRSFVCGRFTRGEHGSH